MEKTESACIQLQHSLSQVQDYRIHIARLETALEKAAMKYALVQLGAERQQQQQQQEEDKQLTRLLRRQPPGRTAAPAAGLSKSLTTERDRGGVTIIRAARSPPTPTAQKLATTDRKTGSARSGGNSPRGATLERCSDQRQQEDDTPRFLSADADDGWEVKNDIVLLMEELRQLIAQGRRLTRVRNGSAAAEQQQEESGWVSGGLRGSPTGGETQQRERREANGARREGASPASERARRRSNEASETSSDPWRETLLSRDLNSTGTSSGVIANNRLQAYIHRHDERRASTPKKAARW
ncbi:PREDICTED: uncharacterized protein LOC106820050 [Priapulus caudatus]|uniref:Uncharacterized protein LOC106820050 n=1 Tax=Priapulus caudatus TaxID=37621 RepID=A0ABM1F6M2_PRICU|nr:PREDICTED: uncharacterized protein LOC106820050 [Priapulus caudatus]